jgi:predicted nuclease of predicted toxin-antitoxin system
MPRFLIDESCGKKLYIFLKENKIDVLFVGDLFHGIEDKFILEFAEKEDRILITDDKDFGELIFRLGKPTAGVIFLRLKNNFVENRQKYIIEIIKKFNKNLKNHFIIVTESKVRIKKLK